MRERLACAVCEKWAYIQLRFIQLTRIIPNCKLMCRKIERFSFTAMLVQLICEQLQELLAKMCTEKCNNSASYFICMYITVSVVECIWSVRKNYNHDEGAKL